MELEKGKNKTTPRQYANDKAFSSGAADGRNGTNLSEPVPQYLGRHSDHILIPPEGKNNNTIIIMGRDRNTYSPKNKNMGPPEDDYKRVMWGSDENPEDLAVLKQPYGPSGYSDYMGAGAIDIIVGRGAPFPQTKKTLDNFPQKLPPIYQTKFRDDLKGKTIFVDPETNIKYKHSGHLMDAARIYISQMCQIDKYFGINTKKGLADHQGPGSAIMLKADKLRMHSRRDIYIVAGGGDNGYKRDSCNYTISEKGKIYLMSQNNDTPTDPSKPGPFQVRPLTGIVRAREMEMCVRAIVQSLQDITELMKKVWVSQAIVNNYFGHEIYGTPLGMTPPNPFSQTANTIFQMSLIEDDIQLAASKLSNIPSIITNYLTNERANYIGSKNVFTN